jgi:hypothetical protein
MARTLVVPVPIALDREEAMTGKTKPAESDDRKKDRDKTLERELEESFPASDPPSSTQPGTRSGGPDRGDTKRSRTSNRVTLQRGEEKRLPVFPAQSRSRKWRKLNCYPAPSSS